MSQEYTIYDYWRILRRRKYTIIISVALVLMATYYFTSRQKPVYRAATTCEVSPSISGAQANSYMWYSGKMLATEARIATSRMVLEKTLKRLELIENYVSPRQLDRAVNALNKSIKVSQDGDTNILRIEVVADKPEKASTLANAIAQVYIETSSWRKSETNKSLRDFMASQLDYVSDKLRVSEEALINYKKTGSLKGVKNEFTRQLSRLKLRGP